MTAKKAGKDKKKPSGKPEKAEAVKRGGKDTDKSSKPTTKSESKKTARDAAEKPVASVMDDPNRPKGMERPAEIDDLKRISGIGPKIEGILHELGIFKFAQIAGWRKPERDWVDNYLSFKGRIERDDWIGQAKTLAGEDD